MAFRYPMNVGDVPAGENSFYIVETDDAYMSEIYEFMGYVHSVYPSIELQVGNYAGDPNLLAGFPLSDTYYIAGSYVTRVDRFATEAETPNISQSSTAYNSIRQIRIDPGAPSSDVNNFSYPLYLNAQDQLQAMNITDFYDTFIAPVLQSRQFAGGSLSLSGGGNYFISSAASVANAVRVSNTPVFTDTIANLDAYTAGGIPETQYQPTTVTEYYLYQYGADESVYAVANNLPLYWDFTSGTIKQHDDLSWAALCGPFLQHYLNNDPDNAVTYDIDGAGGATMGTAMVDTRRVPSGVNYQQRFVNANDYRTQEFPTGTPTTISSHVLKKRLLNGDTYSMTGPNFANEGDSVTFTLTTTNVTNGSVIPYTITGIQAADLSSGSLTGNFTINNNTGQITVTLAFDGIVEGENMTCNAGGASHTVAITDIEETVQLEGTSTNPWNNTPPPLSDGTVQKGFLFDSDGSVKFFDNDAIPTYDATGLLRWVNVNPPNDAWWIRITVFSQSAGGAQIIPGPASNIALNTWASLATGRVIDFTDNRSFASYGFAQVTFKVEIADADGGTIFATGYYRAQYEGGA